jgi:hypothetical protein
VVSDKIRAALSPQRARPRSHFSVPYPRGRSGPHFYLHLWLFGEANVATAASSLELWPRGHTTGAWKLKFLRHWQSSSCNKFQIANVTRLIWRKVCVRVSC